ncbi:hypothetical protein FRC19_009418 [Serendipita sp. 401]|nr:hypothetical protein FRC19_009418 [Serendipita sp. 401]
MNMDLILRISPFTSVYDPPVFPHGSELQGSMNSSFESARVPPIPALFPSVLNKMLHSSQTLDGLHYSSLVMRSQSQILLNLRCNEHFPNRFPFDKTCCSRYPQANWIQALVVVCVIFLGPLLWVGGNNENRVHWALRMAPSSKHSRSFIALGVAVAFCYTADRTGLWTKEQKQFDWTIFGVLCFLGMAACVISGKKGPTHPGLLHRAQTDEWKGWMQIIVLIYHYMDASKLTSVYPIVRTLVASYLFMTGYGHTTFHLKTANYSPLRAAQVLVRLNLLTITLTYVMDTNYMFYYFTPLVSFWYIVVYLTLFIGSFRNDHTLFLAGKIFASFIFVRFIHSQIWIIEGVFRLLNTLANVNWTAEEWAFRVKLDSLIVYVGMLVSITSKVANSGTGSSQGRRLIDHPRWPWVLCGSLGVCILGIAWFILFETSTKSKHTYNVWHPYVSVIPVLAYVGLRNATPVLRETSSRVAEWIGKISLELYVLQSHIWLASDTKGILVLVPGPSSRTINFVVSTIGFVCISHAVAKATKELTKLICGEEEIEFPTTISTANTPIILRNLPSPVTESTSVFLNTSVAPVFSTERDTGHPGSSEPTVENTASILTVAYDNDRTKDETDDGVDTTVRLDKEESSLTSREVAGNELGESQQLAPITPFRKPLHEPQEKSTSLPIRLAMCIGVLWILNIVWPVSSGE